MNDQGSKGAMYILKIEESKFSNAWRQQQDQNKKYASLES